MDTRTGIKLGTSFQVLFRVYQLPYELDGNCGRLWWSSVNERIFKTFWQIVYRSGLHRVTAPGISFINIRSQSRLEENSIKWFW